ncbi:MAG: DNA circularization protein, partial [Plesiomonas sp.]
MSWKKRLLPASFRGVPFLVDDEETGFGRRTQNHEFPNRDKNYAEDLGRESRTPQLTAYLIGPDYMDQRDRLIEALEKAGPGELVNPFYGLMTVSVDGLQRIRHSKQDGGMCTISFSFIESGELSFPTAGVATGRALINMTGALDSAAGEAFMQGFSLKDAPGFISDGVLSNVTTMFDTVM